ncbi:MAG: hypothetical protein ACLFSQ_04340 [Candidatus Zixiibacteriota bacterium]
MKKFIFLIILIASLFSEIDIDDIKPSIYQTYFVYKKDGSPVEELGRWDNISDIIQLGSQYLFRGRKDGQSCYVDAKTGEIIGQMYNNVSNPVEYGGKYVFRTSEGNKVFYVSLETGKPIGPKYDNIGDVFRYDEKAIGRVIKDSLIYFVELPHGKEISSKYDQTGEPFEYAGSLYVAVVKDDKWRWINLLTERNIGGEFNKIGRLDTLPDMVYFPAVLDSQWLRVDFDTGEKLPGRYQQIQYGKVFGDRWANIVKVDDRQWILDNHQNELKGRGYDNIILIMPLGDHWIIRYEEDSLMGWSNIGPDSTMKKTFIDILDTMVIDDEFYFIGLYEDSQQEKIAWHKLKDNSRLSKGFDDIFPLENIDGKYYYRAKNNEKWAYYTLRDGKPVSDLYDFVGEGLFETDYGLIFPAKNGNDAFWGIIGSGKRLPDGKTYDKVCCYSEEDGSFIAIKKSNRLKIDLETGKLIEKLD